MWCVGRNTPLIIAAYRGQAEVVQCLLQCGADVLAKGQHQSTALHCAAPRGHLPTVSVLLDNRADIESRDVNR